MFFRKENSDLDAKIISLAELFLLSGYSVEFSTQARSHSEIIGFKSINRLKKRLRKIPPNSPQYDVTKHGFGGWTCACHFAIFEIIYYFGEDALPFLRNIAWGEYDWIQGNAIELLIRFAAEDIPREDLIHEIKLMFPIVRDEAKLYAIEPLLPRLKKGDRIDTVFQELMEVEGFKDAFEELQSGSGYVPLTVSISE